METIRLTLAHPIVPTAAYLGLLITHLSPATSSLGQLALVSYAALVIHYGLGRRHR